MTNPHLALVAPTTVIGTVDYRPRPPRRRRNAEVRAREYLTDGEIARLIDAAGKNRYGHRDAAMVLVAYRHGLRARRPVIEATSSPVGAFPSRTRSAVMLEARMVNGESIDIATLCTLASTTVRRSQRLGLERRARDVTPSLGQYLAARTAPASGDTPSIDADGTE